MDAERRERIQAAADEAVHTLPDATWGAMPFEQIRSHIRQVVSDASDTEVRRALEDLEAEGRLYRRDQTNGQRYQSPEGWYGPIDGEIRDHSGRDGGMSLELVIKGNVVGQAFASDDVVQQMAQSLTPSSKVTRTRVPSMCWA